MGGVCRRHGMGSPSDALLETVIASLGPEDVWNGFSKVVLLFSLYLCAASRTHEIKPVADIKDLATHISDQVGLFRTLTSDEIEMLELIQSSLIEQTNSPASGLKSADPTAGVSISGSLNPDNDDDNDDDSDSSDDYLDDFLDGSDSDNADSKA